MKSKLRAAALTLTLTLCVLLMPSGASGDTGDSDYFGGANDGRLMPFTRLYMPIMTGKTLLIPHPLLTDTDIGARVEWSERQRYLTLTCAGKSITFELGRSVAFDANNRIYETGMYRSEHGGTVYYQMELDFLCGFFEWSYNIIPTKYGSIVRIKTKDGLLADWQYQAQEWDRLVEYYNTLYPPASPSPPPVSSPPPGPPLPSPSAPVKATPEPEPELSLDVYITFDGALNEHTAALLNILTSHKAHAAFFLTEQGLPDDPATLRRLAATQVVGLCGPPDGGDSPADGPEWRRELAERMNGILDQITFTRTRLTRWPDLYAPDGLGGEDLSASARDALVEGGYRLWDWTLDADAWPQLTPEALSARIIQSLPAAMEGPAVLRFSMDERAVQTLPLLLEALGDTHRFFLRSIGITDRPINRFGDNR